MGLATCLFCTVQPPVEGSFLHGFRFENDETEFKKRFLWLPAKDCPIDANKDETFKKASVFGLPGMQTKE